MTIIGSLVVTIASRALIVVMLLAMMLPVA
jgi:hypothetical protein